MILFSFSGTKTANKESKKLNAPAAVRASLFAAAATLTAPIITVTLGTLPFLIVPSVHAQTFTETEGSGGNNTKGTANAVNITASSPTSSTQTNLATISGTSPTNAAADADYFKITTSFSTPGIYRNQLQLANTTQNIGRIRGLNQTSGVIGTNDISFQNSQISSTPQPYGFDQYYSFGGAGQTQSVYYSVSGAGASTGGAYTATFSSSMIAPTFVGTFKQSTINFDALANLGGTNGTTETDTSIVVLDANYNVYYDNRASSSTFGYAATNNNPAGGGNGFNLSRYFAPGDYYFAVGISNLATNQAAAADDQTRSNSVLDFDNTIATANTFYNGNNGATRPSDFKITDGYGNTFTSSAQVIPSLYALNFYKFTVTATPEPGTVTYLLAGGPFAFLLARRLRRKNGSS